MKTPTPISDNADLYDYQTAVETCRRFETAIREALLELQDSYPRETAMSILAAAIKEE